MDHVLQQLNFDIKYKQGSTHTNVDVLSRQLPPSVSSVTDNLQLPNKSTKLIKVQHDDPLLGALHDYFQRGIQSQKLLLAFVCY